MFLYGGNRPDEATRAPGYDATVKAEQRLWDTTRDLFIYQENANAEHRARADAYERRNKAIHEATGVQLENPFRASAAELERSADERRAGRRGFFDVGAAGFTDWRDRLERDWQDKVTELAREHPDKAAAIRADVPIMQDALAITAGAQPAAERAGQDAEAAGVGGGRQLGLALGAGIAGMMRDPLQVGTLLLGAGPASVARPVLWRLGQVMLTEAAVNGGVEAAVQAASASWKQQAGVETGLAQSLKQVGIAALFGAGFGGLVEGGRVVFGALGKAAPEEALQRLGRGEATPDDMRAIGQALDAPEEQIRTAELAAEQPDLDRAAFGEPPADIPPAQAERLMTDAIRAIEDPADGPPRLVDMEERIARVERIVEAQMPLGKAPPRPASLFQFLASKSVRGIQDQDGELSNMGLRRKFIPGHGPLVRQGGKSLDYAREAAAEAGFFDHLYAPEEAVAKSTVADLLTLIDDEARGKPAFAAGRDRERAQAWDEYEARQAAQQSYRRLIGELDSAADEMGLERFDDALLTRAAQLVDADSDPIVALERALDEDVRAWYDQLVDAGKGDAYEPDIPFFDDLPAAAGARGEAGSLGAEAGGSAGTGREGAPDGRELQDSRAGEGLPPLRRAGDTPEPGTPEAADLAQATLLEARGASETTAAGEQTLIDGVAPVTTRDRLEAEGAKPMRGGDAPPPAGGLFDQDARDQLDMWDALPAARDADGTVRHVTHADMVADADRDEFFGDLIASCKD